MKMLLSENIKNMTFKLTTLEQLLVNLKLELEIKMLLSKKIAIRKHNFSNNYQELSHKMDCLLNKYKESMIILRKGISSFT